MLYRSNLSIFNDVFLAYVARSSQLNTIASHSLIGRFRRATTVTVTAKTLHLKCLNLLKYAVNMIQKTLPSVPIKYPQSVSKKG